MFSIYVLWRNPLGLRLGHCGCRPSELHKVIIALLPLDLDVDRVHVQLYHELGVDVELVERVFIPYKLGNTRVVGCVHKGIHYPNMMHHKHHSLAILASKLHDVVDGRCVFRFPYHLHIIFE